MIFTQLWPFIKAAAETIEFSLVISVAIAMVIKHNLSIRRVLETAALALTAVWAAVFMALRAFVGVEIKPVSVIIELSEFQFMSAGDIIGRAIGAVTIFICMRCFAFIISQQLIEDMDEIPASNSIRIAYWILTVLICVWVMVGTFSI